MSRFTITFKSLSFLLCCVIFGLFLNEMTQNLPIDEAWVDNQVRHFGLFGAGYFMLICAICMACGLPRQVCAFLGGYAFDFGSGILVSTLAATLGCCLCFYCARFIGRYQNYGKYSQHVKRINTFLKREPLTKTVIIRLLPVGSNMITNIVAGLSQINAGRFIIGSCLGYIPQMAIFALMGSGVNVMSYWKIGLSMFLFTLSMLLSFYLYQRYQFETVAKKTT